MIVSFTYFLISCSVDVPNADGSGFHSEFATDDGYIPPPPPPPPPGGGLVKP